MSFRLSSPYQGQPDTYKGNSRSSRMYCFLQTLFSGKFIFSVIRASWRTPLWWLMLSHIGTDVLDEWVFGYQGALGACGPLNPLLQLSTPQTELIFFKKSKTNFSKSRFTLLNSPITQSVLLTQAICAGAFCARQI